MVYVKSILIADDHPTLRACLRESLAACRDWEVFEAENGREAITKAQTLRPDLIVLDMTMPVMNGLEAARELKRLMPNVPLVLWTSHEGAHVEGAAKSAGFDAVLMKSQGSPVLVRKIQNLLLKGFAA